MDGSRNAKMPRPPGARSTPSIFLGSALVACFLLAAPSVAQPVAPPVETPPAQPSETSPINPTLKLLQELGSFQTVIIATENNVRDLSDGTVIIPAESLEAWRAKELSDNHKSETDSTITSVELSIELDDDPAIGHARIDFRVDKVNGRQGTWVPIGLREAVLRNVTVRELVPAPADIGGMKPSESWIPPIDSDPSGYSLRIDRMGTYQADLEFLVDVNRMPLERSIRLSPPPATIPRARFSSKTALATLRNLATGSDIPLSSDRKSAELPLASGQPMSVMWRTGSEETPRASFTSVEGLVSVRIDDRMIETDAMLEIEAPLEIPECTLLLPLGEQNVQVIPLQNDEPLAYELTRADGSDKSRVTIRFGRSLVGRFKLRVLSRRPYQVGETTIDVGQIAVEGAERQGGMILLSWTPDLWVRSKPARHTQKSNLSDLPREAQVLQPRQAYRYSSGMGAVQITIEPARPVLSATAASDLTIGAESAFLTTRFVFSVRGAQADSFVLRVPVDMMNLEASPVNVVRLVPGKVSADKQTREVRATLAEPIEDTEFQLTIRGEIPIDMTAVNRIDLPTLDPDRFMQGTLTVRVGPSVRPILDDAGTEYLRREPMPEDDVVDPPAYWFFRMQSGPARLSFRIEPLPARVEATVESEFLRTGNDIEARTFLRFRARHAPFDEITITIPEAARNVRVSGDLLADDATMEPGTKSLRLRNPASSCELRVDYHYPLTDASQHLVDIPLVLPRGVILEGWKGRVFCDRGWRAIADSPWQSSRPGPSPVVVSGQQPVIDIRPESLTALSDTLPLRFEPTAILATLVVPRVLVEEVLTADGGRWGRKHWLISKHRARDIALQIPVGARVREVFVDGHPTDNVAGANRIVYVRLPVIDAPCTLEIDYYFPDARPDGAFAMRNLESPRFVEDVAVEQVRWIFHVVEDRLMLGLGSAPTERVTWEPSWLSTKDPSETLSRQGVAWLEQANPQVNWASKGMQVNGGRVWQFDAFNRDNSIHLMVILIKEPFWVLICSGTCLILLLAAARLSPRLQLRMAIIVVLVLVGLLAAMPEILVWLWLGARWGLLIGVIALAVHYGLLYRRRRAYSIGLRRFNSRQGGIGSSIFRQLEPNPKTRISTGRATKKT